MISRSVLDNDHQQMMEDLYKVIYILSDNSISMVDKHITSSEIIKSIYSHIHHHFIEEEDYMKQVDFPEFNTHKKEHNEISDEFVSFLKNSGKLSYDEYNAALFSFIRAFKQRILKHIDEEDAKFLPQKSSE